MGSGQTPAQLVCHASKDIQSAGQEWTAANTISLSKVWKAIIRRNNPTL